MALTRSDKQNLIDQYEGGLALAPHAFLVGFSKLTVPQATDLRSRIREKGGHYEVVKNTLALRAIDGKALSGLKDGFRGPTAVAYSDNDPVALAKVLTDFAKETPALEFKGAVIEGRAVESGIEDIARMPSREELIAKLLFLLQSPVTRFVRVLAALPRQLVVVLDQIAQNKEPQG